MEYKWTVVTVTTVGVLMSGIDSRIVIIGLPTVATALNADAEQAIWFTQSYVLASTIATVLFGRITDIVGRIKIYNMGFIVFTIGSALTSLAQDPLQVIVFRGIQGVGSAALFTNSIVMIVDSTPRNQLGLLLGMNQISFRFGAMAGLTISGVILSLLDWRALFYINVPIGIFGTVWCRWRLKEIAKVERGTPVDWVGFGMVTISLCTFLLALTYGAYGLTTESVVITLLAVSALTLAIFLRYEMRFKHPMVDLSLFRIREFTCGVTALLVNNMAWGAFLLLLSLYLQLVAGYSPFEAGIRVIPFDLAFLALGPLSGRLSDRFGALPFTTTGIALTSVGLYLFSLVNATTAYPTLVIYMMVIGAGTGLFLSPNTSEVMGVVPSQRRGIASGVRALLANVGATVSLNITILLMITVAPYALVTQVISSTVTSVAPASTQIFGEALQKTYLWLAAINATAIIPSILTGSRTPKGEAPIAILNE